MEDIKDEVLDENLDEQEEEIVDESFEDESAVIPEVEEDEEVPVRKSAKDYIIERQKKKIEKLSKHDDFDDEFESENSQPNIRQIIEEELRPIKETFLKSKDEEELSQALQKYPEAKKMQTKIRKYMESPAYAQVPVEFIVRGLVGVRDNAKQKADLEAKGTRQGGSSRRPKEPMEQKTAWDMSDDEFDKEVSKAMSQR